MELWHFGTQRKVMEYMTHCFSTEIMAFSPDAKLFAICNGNAALVCKIK